LRPFQRIKTIPLSRQREHLDLHEGSLKAGERFNFILASHTYMMSADTFYVLCILAIMSNAPNAR
jgi:hypothetical protein